MARVYTQERDTDQTQGNNAGIVIAVIIIALILLMLLLGNPLARRSSGGTTNINVPAPTQSTPKAP
jgi:hypothetical protein